MFFNVALLTALNQQPLQKGRSLFIFSSVGNDDAVAHVLVLFAKLSSAGKNNISTYKDLNVFKLLIIDFIF